MQVLLNMMRDEQMIKLKSQAVSATINFVRGLVEDDEDLDADEMKKQKQILAPYSDTLM